MRRHHLRPAGPDLVDVLIPWERTRQSTGFVRICRTQRMPERLFVTGRIRFAKVPRAVADAARGLTRFDDVRQVVCEAVQRRACSVAELTEELEAGPVRGSALFREALAEIGDGVRSVAEADFRMLVLRSGLPRLANGRSRRFGRPGSQRLIAAVSAGRVSQLLWVRHKGRARPGKPRDKSPHNPGIRRTTPLMQLRADPNIQDKSKYARHAYCHKYAGFRVGERYEARRDEDDEDDADDEDGANGPEILPRGDGPAAGPRGRRLRWQQQHVKHHDAGQQRHAEGRRDADRAGVDRFLG
jgi:hypothetical protein